MQRDRRADPSRQPIEASANVGPLRQVDGCGRDLADVAVEAHETTQAAHDAECLSCLDPEEPCAERRGLR